MLIKTLAKSVREYKKPSILSPIFVSLEVILECLMPMVIVWFLDALESEETIKQGRLMEVILVYGGILIGMAVLSLLFGMLSGRFAARASAGFAKNLRKDMYYAIQDYSFANIDRFSTSSLVTRQTTDVMNVQMAYMMLIRVAIRCPFMLIFSLVMAFTMNVTISFVFLALVPVLAAVLVFVILKTHPIFDLFPTDKYPDYQWKNLLDNSYAIDISSFGDSFNPIVETVPNFVDNTPR